MNAIQTVELPMATNRDLASAKYHREWAAFRRLLPTLMQTHSGQYVAIHDEQVIAFGGDRLQVVNEALAKVGNESIHVGLVGPEPMPTSRSGLLRDLTVETTQS